jgi:hypothetical protein
LRETVHEQVEVVRVTNRLFSSISGYLLVVASVLSSVPTLEANIPGAKVSQHAVNSNPGVLPPASSFGGRSYAEWSEQWWLWYIPQTSTNNALTDCSSGQSGQVWFLQAFFSGSTCVVPSGKTLFFPILNVECSNVESGTPFYGATADDRSACSKGIMDDTANLAAEIDGIPVQNVMAYRFQSRDFSFTAPPGNLNGIGPSDDDSGGLGQSTADGYYLLLAPLSAGAHTVHFKGTFTGFDFTIDTTYHLVVGR